MVKLNVIPRGPYCYIIDTGRKKDGESVPIRICPYWQATKDGAKCEYLGEESKKGGSSLIHDQVKECGVNV